MMTLGNRAGMFCGLNAFAFLAMTLPSDAAPGESCADLESHSHVFVVTGTVTAIEARPPDAMIPGFTITASVPSLDCEKLSFIVPALAACHVGDKIFAMGAVQQSQDNSWVLEPPDRPDPTIAEDQFSCPK